MAERRERGSTLLLFPAAVVVLLILASIAVDLSTLHLARRELFRAASQAADDAAEVIDQRAARSDGTVRIDHGAAERVVRFELAVAKLPGDLVGRPTVTFDDSNATVTVGVTMEVRRLFGRAVPGAPRSDRVTVRVSGRLIDLN